MTRPLRKKPTGTESEKTPLINEGSRDISSGDEIVSRNNTSMNNAICATPPVHIGIEDLYEIQTEEEQEQYSRQSGTASQVERPLIDFATVSNDSGMTSSEVIGENSCVPGDASHVVVTTANVHNLLHCNDSTDQHTDNCNVRTVSMTSSPPRSQAPSVLSQQPSVIEDSVSIRTFESDMTDTSASHRLTTDSMQNFAQFSDLDTVSSTSQQS